jgi:hypothetical protein
MKTKAEREQAKVAGALLVRERPEQQKLSERKCRQRKGLGDPDAAAPPPDRTTDWTMSVERAGRQFFGVGRKRAYQLAAEGILPTIRLGRAVRVLSLVLERRLRGEV